MSELVGILPCAGKGTRLFGEGVTGRAKELYPVAGVPMIEYSLAALDERGVRRVILVVAPGKEQVAKYVALSRPSWHVATVYQNEPAGTGRALALLWPLVREGDRYLYLMPDTVHAGMPIRVQPSESSLDLYCWKTDRPERYGVFSFEPDGEVRSHFEKRVASDLPWGPPYWAWGAAAFGTKFLYVCKKSSDGNQGSPTPEHTVDDCFDSWLWSGKRAWAHPCSGYYVDMGTPESLAAADRMLREQASGSVRGIGVTT